MGLLVHKEFRDQLVRLDLLAHRQMSLVQQVLPDSPVLPAQRVHRVLLRLLLAQPDLLDLPALLALPVQPDRYADSL